MKFLTICFLIFYITLLFKRKVIVELVNKINEISEAKIDLILSSNDDRKWDLIKFTLFYIISFLMSVIEVFYMFFALSYLPNTIGIGYIVFWVYLFILGVFKNKKNKNLKLEMKPIQYFINITDILYYLCMVKALFL